MSENDFADVLMIRKSSVINGLTSLWGDLHPGTRAGLLARMRPTDEHQRSALRKDGYLDGGGELITPEWLLAVGESAGAIPSPRDSSGGTPFELTERLHSLVYLVNTELQRAHLPRGFVVTTESMGWGCLTRAVSGASDMAWCVNHLSKTLYEGCRRGEGWRLPDAAVTAYRASYGYQAMVALRNFFDHNPEAGADPEVPNQRFMNEAEVYQRHCGRRSPASSDDWVAVRDGLLRDLCDALDNVLAACRSL